MSTDPSNQGQDDKVLTTDDIKDMSVDEIIDLLLFQSYFSTSTGPTCKCSCTSLNRFMGALPDELCEQKVEDVDLSTVKPFSTQVSSLCACQLSHFFNLSLKDGALNYEATEGKVMDSRKLRLPNFHQ